MGSLFTHSQYKTPEEAIRAGYKKDFSNYIKKSGIPDNDMNRVIETYFIKRDIPNIFPLGEELSKKGYSIGDFIMAWCYEGGEGVEFNLDKAYQYHYKAATAAVPFELSYRSLGYIFGNGEGVKKDIPTALNWFLKGAENINEEQYKSDCYRCIANFYSEGEGVKKDKIMAFKYYKLADETMDIDPRPAYNIGLMYLTGEGTNEDLSQGLKYMEKAAKGGHPMAQFIIGTFLIETKKDPVKGKEWVEKAAKNGNTDAIMYLNQLQQ